MTDNDIINTILKGVSDLITACEVETETVHKVSRIYRFKGGITARYTHIPFASYPQGVVLNSMPKDQIEITEPEQRVIYKTDWID